MGDFTRIKSGEMPYATDWNSIVEKTEHLLDKVGREPVPFIAESIKIYELTEDPTLDENWDIYKAKAKRVLSKHTSATAGDFVMQESYPEEDVWFALPSDNTEPSQNEGDRVSTILMEGKRIVLGSGGGTSTTHAFKYAMLLENLLANGGPVRARVFLLPQNTPTAEIISVYDAVLASGSYAGGSKVKADLNPDDNKYYVSGSACTVSMSTP